MRFWFEHSGEVSLREQIVTQVSLGVLTGELSAGERLPSIRELARRFHLHANTVSAGYRQLETEGWVQSRRGSGVFVRATPPSSRDRTPATLDRLVANLFAGARRLEIPEADVRARVLTWSASPAMLTRLMIVEPDPELRSILVAELGELVSSPVSGCSLGELGTCEPGTLLAALPSKLEQVRSEAAALASWSVIATLRVRSVPESIAEHLSGNRPGILVGIASRWPEFLRFARTLLIAAGVAPEALILRDAREPDWQHGLPEAAAVVCDVVTAARLPNIPAIVFRILAEANADELTSRLATS